MSISCNVNVSILAFLCYFVWCINWNEVMQRNPFRTNLILCLQITSQMSCSYSPEVCMTPFVWCKIIIQLSTKLTGISQWAKIIDFKHLLHAHFVVLQHFNVGYEKYNSMDGWIENSGLREPASRAHGHASETAAATILKGFCRLTVILF